MSAWDLVSALAAQVHEPLDVNHPNGLQVHFENGFYWIRFPYEHSIVAIMRSISAAQYLPTERLWCVPLIQYESLRGAIERMCVHYRALAENQEHIQQWCALHHPNRQVRKAYTKDGAAHIGTCLMTTPHYCVITESAHSLRVHERSALVDALDSTPFTPQEHRRYRIEYRDGIGRCFSIQESEHA